MLNRNIITKSDKQKYIAKRREQIEKARESGVLHPERSHFGDDGIDLSKSEPDTPASRITKYFPGEALAFFLAMAGVFNVENENLDDSSIAWAAGIIFLSLVFNVIYCLLYTSPSPRDA